MTVYDPYTKPILPRTTTSTSTSSAAALDDWSSISSFEDGVDDYDGPVWHDAMSAESVAEEAGFVKIHANGASTSTSTSTLTSTSTSTVHTNSADIDIAQAQSTIISASAQPATTTTAAACEFCVGQPCAQECKSITTELATRGRVPAAPVQVNRGAW